VSWLKNSHYYQNLKEVKVAELYILLKIASMLDKDLEVRIYKVFIENKILLYRDLGGDNFKENEQNGKNNLFHSDR
jgi:hypothetical protein